MITRTIMSNSSEAGWNNAQNTRVNIRGGLIKKNN